VKNIKYDLESELKVDAQDKALNLKIMRLKDLSLKLANKFKLKNCDVDGIQIVALIFGNSGKAYFFSPGNFKLNTGDIVRVHDSSNIERLAGVVIGNSKICESSLKKDLRPVIEVVYKNIKENSKNKKIL
jgi:hypothetical protein